MVVTNAIDAQDHASTTGDGAPDRRARVAVLGEFSAGKSTFINLVTGGRTLRTQVTATQMPAVWMTHGLQAPYRVDLDGNEIPVDLQDRSSIPVDDTAYVRVFMQTPMLELCDLIDTPGNSDPNIPPIAWERIADIADVAVWCSSATQAWRQSEAAAWSEIPEKLRKNSILLLTRADKLTSRPDREKVLRRVTAEAGDLFGSIHMGSLLNFDAVRPALRDIVDLCRSIDETQTPDPIETAHILRGVVAGNTETPAPKTKDASATAKSTEQARDAAFAQVEIATKASTHRPPDRTEQQTGAATALWLQLTEGLPADDTDGLDRAFGQFLTRLDGEIQVLREIANIGKVG